MREDIAILKRYRNVTDEMKTKIALQRLIDVLEAWRKNVRNTKVNK